MAPISVAISVAYLWPMAIDKMLLILMLVASGSMLGAWGEDRRRHLRQQMESAALKGNGEGIP
jgi:hypothetical protein